jgi:hypothetical protein
MQLGHDDRRSCATNRELEIVVGLPVSKEEKELHLEADIQPIQAQVQ